MISGFNHQFTNENTKPLVISIGDRTYVMNQARDGDTVYYYCVMEDGSIARLDGSGFSIPKVPAPVVTIEFEVASDRPSFASITLDERLTKEVDISTVPCMFTFKNALQYGFVSSAVDYSDPIYYKFKLAVIVDNALFTVEYALSRAIRVLTPGLPVDISNRINNYHIYKFV